MHKEKHIRTATEQENNVKEKPYHTDHDSVFVFDLYQCNIILIMRMNEFVPLVM